MQLSYQRLLQLLCFVLTVGLLASCKKDNDDTNDGRVQLFSFGPTGAKHGDTLRFIGVNLNKVTAVHFTGTNAVVEEKDFKQKSSDLLLVVVPTTAEKGTVTLKAPDGDIVTKTALNLNVKTAASVASVTRNARPGENITLTGSYMNWVNRVTFNRNKVVTTFVSKTQNQVVVTVPEDAQTGPLLISFAGTDTIDVQSTDTLFVALPVATSFSPNPVKHNTNLTITGTNLDLARQVVLPGVSRAIPRTSFVSQSATQLVVRVDSATVKGKVTLIPASGVPSTSVTDLDVVMPAITGMSPDPVAIGGNLTITGTNLDVVKSINFTGVAAAVTSFVSQSATQLVVKVPTGSLTGKVTLNILNTGQTVKSAADLKIAGSSVAPIVVYDNALSSNWEKWGGWGTAAQELENTERPQSGTKAIKVTYSDAYGALQLHPRTTFAFPPPGYTKLKISIYGGAGTTATSRVAIYMKDATDPTEAQKRALTLVPGAYTTYEIPLSAFGNNPAKVNEFVIQNYGTANITIYIDDIWFE